MRKSLIDLATKESAKA